MKKDSQAWNRDKDLMLTLSPVQKTVMYCIQFKWYLIGTISQSHIVLLH